MTHQRRERLTASRALWSAGNLVPGVPSAGADPGTALGPWAVRAARPGLAPHFALVEHHGKTALLAAGSGSADCAAWLVAPVSVRRGRTYRLRARCSFSPELNPHQHLLFAFYTRDFNDGIFHYRRLGDCTAEGEGRFLVPGRGRAGAEVRVGFRLSATGKAWIEAVSLEECEPVPARPVTVAAMQGEESGLLEWEHALRAAGRAGADLVTSPRSTRLTGGEALCSPPPAAAAIAGTRSSSCISRSSRKPGAGGRSEHCFARAGRYLVRVQHVDRTGPTATAHLLARVGD